MSCRTQSTSVVTYLKLKHLEISLPSKEHFLSLLLAVSKKPKTSSEQYFKYLDSQMLNYFFNSLPLIILARQHQFKLTIMLKCYKKKKRLYDVCCMWSQVFILILRQDWFCTY